VVTCGIVRSLFDHVTIRVSDRAASEEFYDTVLQTLGIEKTYSDEHFAEWDEFSLAAATHEKPLTARLHVGFTARSRTKVDEFWQVGVDAGYRDDGAPGPRPQYSESYYGGFLLDLDGNSVEGVHHANVDERGVIDHVWMRVADVAASRRFYEAVGSHAGFRLGTEKPERATFAAADRSGSFSVVAGTATQNVHLAFPVNADAIVDAFHRELTAAGYRDNGAPGVRDQYSSEEAGRYYAAFLLDPDGNNIEAVRREFD
jgi:catechol 2,3-dioxygenase-like lactoylglutathione lyase family enzyme